jgi:phosphopantothenoylcysteine decarboxylase/phosphopantothenate--cysteine ligase
MLVEKKILIGVTGSIAAYKVAFLTRLLIQSGAEVRIIMTPSAKDFITPLTLSTLSKHPVLVDYFNPANGEWNNHVDLGGWPDVFVIAPATANTMFKMAHGAADNLLLVTYFSARCPVYFAPAMDLEMYQHPTTKRNIKTLQSFGNQLIEPGKGELASGLDGEGRMAEPEKIVNRLEAHFLVNTPLTGKQVLINAGPTYELIDPVRFIGNRSTGKMGYALAQVARDHGAKVVLVTGPSSLAEPKGMEVVHVETAAEMREACMKYAATYDVGIFSAAVADYTVKEKAIQKIKKTEQHKHIELVPTQDILKAFGSVKKAGQLLVGFALETENELEYAKKKRLEKNLDLIVLNSLNDKGAGFAEETNKVTLIGKDNKPQTFQLKDKSAVAVDIINKINELISSE